MKLSKYFRAIKKVLNGEKCIKIKFLDTGKGLFDLDNEYPFSQENDFVGKIITIDGIGWSGSSAVTDFLGEFGECLVLGGVDLNENPDRGEENNFECDFFRNPHSIYELEKICYNHTTRVGDTAIYEFIDTVNHNYRFGPKLLFHNDNYLSCSKEFLSNIIDYKTVLCGKTRYIVKKLSVSKYRKYAQEYIHKIFTMLPKEKFIVFDQLLSIDDPDENIVKDYFGETTKVIYVWRDPRDIYASARLAGASGDWVPTDPELFVRWYTFSFPDYYSNKSENLLVLRFEDFVLDYENSANTIINFTGFDSNKHLKKKTFFNPDISKNNIGIYKKIEDKYLKELEYIEKNLKQYCFYG